MPHFPKSKIRTTAKGTDHLHPQERQNVQVCYVVRTVIVISYYYCYGDWGLKVHGVGAHKRMPPVGTLTIHRLC